ncbi:MAG TPA: AAA family ATPase, partial [Acidimicrobiales bacterium]|nr:AAA family ATPase [Acidimicrobiales bacterium]
MAAAAAAELVAEPPRHRSGRPHLPGARGRPAAHVFCGCCVTGSAPLRRRATYCCGMYTRVTIHNFRGLRHLDLQDLRRINLLTGPNNIGKTSVLEALF